ncbi:lysozyme [Niameybacter massiliensis]|uniref:Lysozyme n=1 Tax=Holtiella tumoricola TaxID=3018743 RepID=A0AA42DNR5_9FIRM|nr:lysozyme [Holtiella tumoricola]MDA3732398.1 lysozyme [Holtiella tumoricola]
MNISKIGIDLIKSFEGCYLKAYKCPAGVWTIGWGTTEPINGVKPHEGMSITQQQADDLLVKNLKSYENAVNKYVTYTKLNQNQYDALVSFTYNCGAGALQKSDLLKKLNKGDVLGAADEFLRWNKGGGKVLSGLVRRREAEKKLFLKEDKEVIKKVKIKLNGVEKNVEAIEKDGHNYVKLQDLRDGKIDIGYDGVPVIQVKVQ